MGNIMPVTYTLDGPALIYACHQYQKKKHASVGSLLQNQQASRDHMNSLKCYVGYEIISEHFSTSLLK
jgi:hypothetical protein